MGPPCKPLDQGRLESLGVQQSLEQVAILEEAGSGSYSYGHAVGNPVWGQVVIWQLLVLVALSDHADDGVEVLAESGHGLFNRFLDEMLFWIHAQEQLRNQTQTDRPTDMLLCSAARVTDRPSPTHRVHPLGVTSATCQGCPENANATPNLAFPKEAVAYR